MFRSLKRLVEILVSFILILWGIRTCVTNYVCSTETLPTITDLSGFDFLVTDRNCDTIGNSDVTSVFISKTGDDRHDLMFEYDGGAANHPDFDVDDKGVIQVAVRYLYEVRERKDNWNGAAIEYNLTWGWLPEIVAPTLPVRPSQNLAPGGVGDHNVLLSGR